MRQIDRYWSTLFQRHEILRNIEEDGFYTITSTQINQVHEARLMTKFDNRANLPAIFVQNQISILPITRGTYCLGHFDAYHDVTYADIRNINFHLPDYIESIDINNLYSESACLHCAYVSGMIDDIAQETTLPTVSGRMSAGRFGFNIRNIRGYEYPITVENSQLEIDGGYESQNKLIIIEAKNFSIDDFLIRQLYYPYRLWHSKIPKEIVPVFMTYSNDVFSFFIYRFSTINEYNSLELVTQRNYVVEPEPITLDDINDVLQRVSIIPEPEIPFPQADTIERIVDLLGILFENEVTSDYITNNYAFTYRQTAYYTTAAIYLGLVERGRLGLQTSYSLTPVGRHIMGLRHKQKFLSLIHMILRHEVFNRVLRRYFDTASPVSRSDIVRIMNTCPLYHINTQNTVQRRAQTVQRWIEWILDLVD